MKNFGGHPSKIKNVSIEIDESILKKSLFEKDCLSLFNSFSIFHKKSVNQSEDDIWNEATLRRCKIS